MIEKAGKILNVNSRYAVVQLTHQTTNGFFAKLFSVLSPKSLSATTTVRARNSIYAQPDDIVIVGMPSPYFFNTFIRQTNHCLDNSAIILRCINNASVSEIY